MLQIKSPTLWQIISIYSDTITLDKNKIDQKPFGQTLRKMSRFQELSRA